MLETLSYVATIVGAFGFFFGVIIFFIETRRRREEQELATHDNLAREYREFLKICFENSNLVNIYDYDSKKSSSLDANQKMKKYILFDILVSLFETAYFQYHFHTNEFKRKQWNGWVAYMEDWCQREDFQQAWNEQLNSEFDSDFLKLMNDLISKHSKPN